LLKKRLGESVDGRMIASAVQRTRFQDPADLLINDYEINGHRSLVRAKRSILHLREFFSIRKVRLVAFDTRTSRAQVEHKSKRGAPILLRQEA
jgi:hypothetical protein